uniref:Putative secreted protein n=1 Tax=Panstrongylus lignarius TaxID=156445 RepID=A0A224XU82_9HEMI
MIRMYSLHMFHHIFFTVRRVSTIFTDVALEIIFTCTVMFVHFIECKCGKFARRTGAVQYFAICYSQFPNCS